MKSFAVIGCGRFGSSVARTLYELGNDVLAIDSNAQAVENIASDVTHAVQADAMDETVFTDLGVQNVDVVIIGIGTDLEASILATLVAKDLGVPKIVAKAQSELHGKVLMKIGADKIVYPERDMGIRVAHNLTSKSIIDYIEISPEYSIMEISALKQWHNKSIADLRLRNKYGINVMAIRSNDGINLAPSPSDVISEDDVLVVLGSTDDIIKIEGKSVE